jgi:hypothetical protein
MRLIAAEVVTWLMLVGGICLHDVWTWRPCRRGHAWRRVDRPTRIFLRCEVCGNESPGWDLFGVPAGCERQVRGS